MDNEPTIESLREEIAAKDAALAEMKEAAAAGKAVAQEYENAKAEFAQQLAERDAKLAEADAQFADARSRWEADTLAARKAAEDAAANAKAEFAKQLAEKDAEIASLKAAAKTAEQIAAEKYGAGTQPVAATPAGDPAAFKDRLKAAYGDASAMSRLVKERWNNG